MEIINRFESFHGFFDICFYFDKTDEINKLNLVEIHDDEKDSWDWKCMINLFVKIVKDL